MDDLDDELRKLFSDDRLDVHVTPDATDSVVSGAARRRRRRTAATGTFALVALIGAGVGLSQLHVPDDDTAGPVLSTSSSATTTTPPPPSISTYTQTRTVTVEAPLPGSQNTGQNNATPPNSSRPRATSTPPTAESGPGLYGKLALGMSEENAVKTGELGDPGAVAGDACRPFALKSGSDLTDVLISPAKGIARIRLPSAIKTSKGIGAGSAVTDLKTAYPAASQSGSELVVQMTATPRWEYVFENDGSVVTRIRMRLAGHDCPGA